METTNKQMDLVAARAPQAPDWFDPLSDDFILDPAAGYAQVIGAVGPVFFAPKLGAYFVTGHENVKAVADNTETFSSATMPKGQRVPAPLATQVPRSGYLGELMIMTDPPEHTASRRLANLAFRPPAVAAYEAPIKENANRLIDAMLAEDRRDIMQAYALPLTYGTLCALLGLPTEDVPMLEQLAVDVIALRSDYITPLAPPEHLEIWNRWLKVRDYLSQAVKERVEKPRGDLISHYAKDLGSPGAPTLQKIVTDLSGIIAAGADTTATTIGHGVLFLSDNPDQLNQLVQDPSLWANATEEIMRRRGSIVAGPRVAKTDTMVAGVAIPAGATVMLAFASASNDPALFPDPTTLDVRRQNAREHFSFSKGRHLCLGAPLARVQARIALQTLFEQLPKIRALPGQRLDYSKGVGVTSLHHLQVAWD